MKIVRKKRRKCKEWNEREVEMTRKVQKKSEERCRKFIILKEKMKNVRKGMKEMKRGKKEGYGNKSGL